MDEISQELNRNKKAILRWRQKDRKFWELSSKINELIISKTDIRNKINALKQIISHVEKVKDSVKLKIEELKKKTKNIPTENPFDFTEYVENQKEHFEIDLGFFSRISRRKQDCIQSNTSKHSPKR